MLQALLADAGGRAQKGMSRGADLARPNVKRL
jgi:hypothetical protein